MTDTYPNFPKEKWLQEIYIYAYTYTKTLLALKGGQGSGNFGHAGRPGEVGGSASNSSWENKLEINYEKIRSYNYIGLRALRSDEQYEIGDTARNSRDWDFENDISADYELNGTSTLGISMGDFDSAEELESIINKMLPDISKYGDDGRIVLLGGYNQSYGDDPNESVIQNAEVVLFITK